MLLGKSVCPSDLILFIVQVFLITVVISVSLFNLTFEIGNRNLWTIILTSALGYILPNPKLRICKKVIKVVPE